MRRSSSPARLSVLPPRSMAAPLDQNAFQCFADGAEAGFATGFRLNSQRKPPGFRHPWGSAEIQRDS